MALKEFPPLSRPGFRPQAVSPEQVIKDLAPTIHTEAALLALLEHAQPDQRAAIEKCLRDNGACRTPETPPC